MFKRIRDDSNREAISFYIENGEAYAVQGNGSFFNDEGSKPGIEPEIKFPTAVFVGYTGAGSGAV